MNTHYKLCRGYHEEVIGSGICAHLDQASEHCRFFAEEPLCGDLTLHSLEDEYKEVPTEEESHA